MLVEGRDKLFMIQHYSFVVITLMLKKSLKLLMPALGARMTYIAQQRQTVDKPDKEVEQKKKKAELSGA